MNLTSYLGPVFIKCEEETAGDPNLVAFKPEELSHKCVKVDSTDHISVGQRLLRSAMEAIDTCDHSWGMAHFWGNPKMLPPCKVTKIDGVWYKRKDCGHVDWPEYDETT